MRCLASSVLFVVLSTCAALAQGEGYEFRGNQIWADQPYHWRNWVYPNTFIIERSTAIDSTGLFDISVLGIKPKYFPRTKNYVLDRAQFSYSDEVLFADATLVQGHISALSNTDLAANVGDGDVNTYWEPAAADFNQDGLRNWQLEINLGRAVWADSIVVLLPPIEDGGNITVPLVAEDVLSLSALPVEVQAEVARLGRRVALEDLRAPQTLVSVAGDTLARQGEVLLVAGQRLPTDLSTLKLYNQLGIVVLEVQGEADLGDPPKFFTVNLSLGNRAGGNVSSRGYRFDFLGRAAVVGSQRRVTFVPEPFGRADFDLDGNPDVSGTFMHLLRLNILDSDFNQKEFLGEGEAGQQAYEALGPQRQGQKVFQRITAGNFFKPVAEEVYDRLPEVEKGPIRYFKRELPRVAEVQVWGPGPNLAYRPERRAGGGYEDGGLGSPDQATDGVYLTRWLSRPWNPDYSTGSGGGENPCCTMWLDLGAVFWIDNIYLWALTLNNSGNSNEGVIPGLHMQGSDGTAFKPFSMRKLEDLTQVEFSLTWTDLVSEAHKNNLTAQGNIMREGFGRRRLRFFELRNIHPLGSIFWTSRLSEIQMYGGGYPAEVSFTSEPIILLAGVAQENASQVKERRVLSQIFWEGEAIVQRVDRLSGRSIEVAEALDLHPEVRLEIQTRSSDTTDSLFSYYEVIGKGTLSERRDEVELQDYLAVADQWAEYSAWAALPERRTLQLRAHQTGRDDDGDGRIDEDLIDGMDNDSDLLIDEDALSGSRGGPNDRGSITLTKHIRRRDDDGDGVQDEDPIDGMDNDGDLLIDEDGKKIPKPRRENLVEISSVFAGWSPWSAPYQPTNGENRAQITSPSPRKFLQVRVNIVSDDPNVTARLRSLRVDFSPPISTAAVGELALRTPQGLARAVADLLPLAEDYAPPRDISPFAQQPFSYFLRAAGPDPNVSGVREGFDEVLLVTPFGIELTGVRLGSVEVEEGGDAGVGQELVGETQFLRSFVLDAAGILRAADGAALEVHRAQDSLLVRFPDSVNRGFDAQSNALVELQFKAQVLRAGTEFLAFVGNSTSAERIFQRVEGEGGDATELVNSQTARPITHHSASILEEVVVPQVFTPNGDGINDALAIRFTLLNLREDRPLQVGFFDLAGRPVAPAQPRNGKNEGQIGTLHYSWDGRDSAGKLVAPGIYLCRIQLQSDKGDIRETRLVNLVY